MAPYHQSRGRDRYRSGADRHHAEQAKRLFTISKAQRLKEDSDRFGFKAIGVLEATLAGYGDPDRAFEASG